jgi:hypothetical protein
MELLTDEREFIGITIAIVLSFGLLYHLIDAGVFLITATTGIAVAVLGLVPLFLTGSHSNGFRLAFFSLFLVFIVPLGYAAVHLDWIAFSPISLVLLVALAFVFFYYSIFFPLAFLHASQQDPEFEPEPPYPTVSVIIPAYNEESCISASVQALQQADYPTDKKELIIVDDGSTDETYEEAVKQADHTVGTSQLA